MKKFGFLLSGIVAFVIFTIPAFGGQVYLSETNRQVTLEKDLATDTLYAIDEYGTDALRFAVSSSAPRRSPPIGNSAPKARLPWSRSGASGGNCLKSAE